MSRVDELIADLCPTGVRFAPIGEIADVSAGATPLSGRADYWVDGTIPWMSSGEVNFGTIYATEKRITQAGYESCSTKMLPPGTVVMALAGQGKTRGLVARTRIELCTNQSLAGIVPCRVDLRTNLSREIVQRLRERFGDVIFDSTIRENVRLAEAPSFEQPITTYAPHSTGASDYRAVAAELLGREHRRAAHEPITTSAGG